MTTNKIDRTRIVKRDGEWIVLAYVNGKRYPNGDYYTDDKQDAEETAKAMVQ